MKSIRTLDVTLRDGGCVNNFNFGLRYMNKILTSLEKSGVDIIELGYIDDKKGSFSDRTQYINEKSIYQNFLKKKKSGIEYVAMIDYGKYNVTNLEERREEGIDGIRVAFHKKDRFNVISFCREIISKGYHLYVQPMTIMRYTDAEIIEFINLINAELAEASAFYVVDSFGEMRMNDMQRILNLVDHNLDSRMTIGFHSHNNLQLSYSNAVTMLQFQMNRNVIIDSSLVGMGKGAGNLNTELFLEHLNLFYEKTYKLAPLLEVIDNVINQIKEEFHWGYSVEYYLSSANHCTPSYASYYYNKHMLAIDQVAELLNLIEEDKKISFDEKYAEDLYRLYNEKKSYNDENVVSEIQQKFNNKKVFLIAPGKSIKNYEREIEKYLEDEDYISVSMNMLQPYKVDYVLVTRQEIYDEVRDYEQKLIITSNVKTSIKKEHKVIDYKKWISVADGETLDSSGIVILNLLEQCNVKEIVLAGFDGYQTDMNENYFDIMFRRPVSSFQAQKRNRIYSNFMREKKIKNIVFLTPSKYEVYNEKN